jgi:hypothetical protein
MPYGAWVIFTLLLSASHLGMLPPCGVVAPPDQAGGEAFARCFVLDMIKVGIVVTGCIPAAMTRRGINALCASLAAQTKHFRRDYEI